MASPPTLPEQFKNSDIALLASTLAYNTRISRHLLGEVTPEELAFVWAPGKHSAGAVLLHHAEAEAWWVQHIFAGEDECSVLQTHVPEFTANWEETGWPVLAPTTLAALYERIDRVRQDFYDRLAGVEELQQPAAVESSWGATTLDGILRMMIWHESYHYGQAVMLVDMARTLGKAAIADR